jgi:hypothetical protein
VKSDEFLHEADERAIQARAMLIMEVAIHHPPDQRGELLRESFDLIDRIDRQDGGENSRDRILNRVAIRLSARDCPYEALAAVMRMEKEWWIVETIDRLASQLPPEGVEAALGVIRRADRLGRATEALIPLAKSLPTDLQEDAWRSLLGEILQITIPARRSRLLTLIVGDLPQSFLKTVVRAADKMTPYDRRVEVVGALVPLVADAELPWVLDTLFGRASFCVTRSKAVSAFAHRLDEPLLRKALAAAARLDRSDRADAEIILVPRLAALGHADEALAITLGVENSWQRARQLAELCAHLEKPALVRVRAHGDTFDDERLRYFVADAAAARLATLGNYDEAIETVRHILRGQGDSHQREQEVVWLTRSYSRLFGTAWVNGRYEHAMDVLRRIPDDISRAEQIYGISTGCPAIVMPQIIAFIRELRDADAREYATVRVVEWLAATDPIQAANTLRAFSSKPHWTRGGREDDLIRNRPYLAMAIENAAPFFSAPLLSVAIECTDAMEEVDRDGPMAAVARRYAELGQIGFAWRLLEGDGAHRHYQLAPVADHLPDDLAEKAFLELIRDGVEGHLLSLGMLARRVARLPPLRPDLLWDESIIYLSRQPRQLVLDKLVQLRDLYAVIVGIESVGDLWKAILKVSRQWQ